MDGIKEKKQFFDDVKKQWKTMWLQRIDDMVRAEGIAVEDYSLLFVERGTVIAATRKFKPPDFFEILRKHNGESVGDVAPPSVYVGGWGRFIRTVLKNQLRFGRRRNRQRPEPLQNERQQLRKGGRGWLHRM